MTANPPKRHHYIPAFYLQRWIPPSDNLLCEFRKFGDSISDRRRAPKATGFEPSLYELKGFQPELAQQVEEKFFKPIDTWASEALSMMERDGAKAKWTSASRSAWTRFILSLLLRCPEDIALFREWWHDDFAQTDAEAEVRYAAARGEGDPETFSAYLDAQPLAVKERTQFEVLASLIDHETIGARINDMTWQIYTIPQVGPSLLTSDRPVIRTHSLASPGGHIVLPVGPYSLFVASHDNAFLRDLSRVSFRELAKECNRQVIGAAKRFAYGFDARQLPFIRKRMGTVDQPRIMEMVIRRRRDAASAGSQVGSVTRI